MADGELVGLIGLNGAGKSTLLRLLTADFFPSEGQAEILGYSFGNGDITGLRKQIGIVSSFITERLPKHMTAEKIVLTGKYKSSILYKAYGDKELQEAKDMLVSLGAGELIGRQYHGLSQGEKQICLIARSLMEDPDIIILDEATVGLDLFAREKLWSFMSPTTLRKSLKIWTTSFCSAKERSWLKGLKMTSSHRKSWLISTKILFKSFLLMTTVFTLTHFCKVRPILT